MQLVRVGGDKVSRQSVVIFCPDVLRESDLAVHLYEVSVLHVERAIPLHHKEALASGHRPAMGAGGLAGALGHLGGASLCGLGGFYGLRYGYHYDSSPMTCKWIGSRDSEEAARELVYAYTTMELLTMIIKGISKA